MDALSRPWLWTMLAALLAGGLALAILVQPVEAAPAPVVSGVSPAAGPSVGGTAITIAGTGFAAGATVTVGGTPATSVVVASATSITAVTPAGTAGSTAVIVVTNADTQSASLNGNYYYNYPAPTVATIAPNTGTSAGGLVVMITGTDFRAGASVTMGGVAATDVAVLNSTTIRATAAPHTIGTVSIVVTNNDAQSGTLASAYTYTAATAPVILSVAPASGTILGGLGVTLNGTNFVPGATVTFGGVPATSVYAPTSATIYATTPAVSATGPVAVVVTNPDTQSGTLPTGFTYTPRPAPTVTTVTPTTAAAAGGTTLTLAGSGFVPGATVKVAGVPASGVTVLSASSIIAIVPMGTPGAAAIAVTNPDGQTYTASSIFSYTANATPTLASVAPAEGPVAGGTVITITGTNYLPGAVVLIDGAVASTATLVSNTTITVVAPPHIAAAVQIKVVNYDGLTASSSATAFTYKAQPTPTLTTIDPTSGPIAGGGTVTLTGTNFVTGATVTIGAFSATSVSVASATSITATVPFGVAGTNVVTVRNPDGQVASLDKGYTFVGGGPAVTAVSPDAGPVAGGTSVTITGDGFVSGATVQFGTTAATKVVFVSTTELTATTPAGSEGAVAVSVTNPGTAAGVLPAAFTYQAAGTANVAATPAQAGGLTIVQSGTADIQTLIKAQKFPVSAIYLLDVAKQTWKIYVVGAPTSVNTLTAIKPTDIVILRR